MESSRETNKYAFVVLKSDVIRQFLDINIIQEAPKEGLEIIKHKMVKLTKEQVAAVYEEKLNENYYPFLEKFLTEEPSICLLLKSEADAIRRSQEFKDKIRANFKVKKFKISKKRFRITKRRSASSARGDHERNGPREPRSCG